MEENDFQIKGFPVRLPLDILIIASANPEDYTSRGRIITPLKDRFDVQVRTHYPANRETEIAIAEQEARHLKFDGYEMNVPDFIKQILAEITLQARSNPDVSQHSGVSCRVTIRSYESIVGAAMRRCLSVGEKRIVPRVTDVESTFPAIVGKLELEYESAGSSEAEIVEDLAKRAVKVVFDEYFDVDDLTSIVEAFDNGMGAEVSQLMPSKDYMDGLKVIPGMKEAVDELVDSTQPAEVSAAIEFILEGLHLSNKLNREVSGDRRIYK
jgi:magnesium chelatase subunit I